MKKTKTKANVTRRDFMTKAGYSATIAGAATLATATGASASVEDRDRKSSGYRETDHIRTYYDLAKF